MSKYDCNAREAEKISEWLDKRGGLLIWRSVNLSNPGGSWLTPYLDEDGKVYTKPNWQCDSAPEQHITSVDDVAVYTDKEVKRFHVATRMGGSGLSVKVTDAGTRRIRAEVAKAAEKYGKEAWYVFDYGDDKNCVIMIQDELVPLAQWLEKHGVPL